MFKRLAPLLLVVFVDLLGFGIVIPNLPYVTQSYDASGLTLGFLMASFSLMQMIFAPIWGALSDRFGRKPILLSSIAFTGISMLIMGFSNSIEGLFLGRILAGIFSANFSVAFAMAADLTSEDDRSKAMGLIGAAFGMGFIFGPAIGGILGQNGLHLPMLFAAGLSFINFPLTLWILKEPRKSKEEREKSRTRRFRWSSYRSLNRDARACVIAFFLTTLALTQIEVLFAMSLFERFGFNPKQAGLCLAFVGLLMAFVQGGLIGRLSKKMKEIQITKIGVFFGFFGILGFAFSPTISTLLLSLAVMAIGQAMIQPSLSSRLTKITSSSVRGSVMGVFQSASAFARVIGPAIAGFAWDFVSHHSAFLFAAVSLGLIFMILKSSRGSDSMNPSASELVKKS
jgi:multidrug resistance protein